jgi:hypothetical protein
MVRPEASPVCARFEMLNVRVVTRMRSPGAGRGWTVTPKERLCIAGANTFSETLECVAKPPLIETQQRCLRTQTEATEEQIEYVTGALDAMDVTEVRKLADSGVGEAVYASAATAVEVGAA